LRIACLELEHVLLYSSVLCSIRWTSWTIFCSQLLLILATLSAVPSC